MFLWCYFKITTHLTDTPFKFHQVKLIEKLISKTFDISTYCNNGKLYAATATVRKARDTSSSKAVNYIERIALTSQDSAIVSVPALYYNSPDSKNIHEVDSVYEGTVVPKKIINLWCHKKANVLNPHQAMTHHRVVLTAARRLHHLENALGRKVGISGGTLSSPTILQTNNNENVQNQQMDMQISYNFQDDSGKENRKPNSHSICLNEASEFSADSGDEYHPPTYPRLIEAKFSYSGIVLTDERDKPGKQPKSDPQVIESVRKHINTIPEIRKESHYLCANTSRVFIAGGLTLAALHRDS
ncbi:unnamed protein product [Parnassius apollo]|uniref:(apollo) hypothetical protein n=1 Tax=Parnassius apollo TaxID=110799 RepID=A0A8S3Y9G3_PARAO|nr:unnamed protein product [Parnassius apollo]